MPDDGEVRGLLALMLLHDSRRAARVDERGRYVPLDEQDRSRWDQGRIREGLRTLETALRLRRPGPYQLQAAIAALHARASDASETDWAQIAQLYETLGQIAPSPVVELNRAVAVALRQRSAGRARAAGAADRRGVAGATTSRCMPRTPNCCDAPATAQAPRAPTGAGSS